MSLSQDVQDLEDEAAGWEARADAAENALKAIGRSVKEFQERKETSVLVALVKQHIRDWEIAIGLEDGPEPTDNRPTAAPPLPEPDTSHAPDCRRPAAAVEASDPDGAQA